MALPRRILHDWDPDGPLSLEDWLAAEYDAGWVPDPLYNVEGAWAVINGKRVRRYAMIEGVP